MTMGMGVWIEGVHSARYVFDKGRNAGAAGASFTMSSDSRSYDHRK